MSLQIYIADDWPGAPAAETPTEVYEVPDDPRTLLYLVDDHLAAVAEAQALAEAEAYRRAALEQQAVREAVLQAAIEQARERAEQEARARAQTELAQLIIALAQEEAVLDALGRRALLLNALPAEPVYHGMLPQYLHPDSYTPDTELDESDTYGNAIAALLNSQYRQPRSAGTAFQQPNAQGPSYAERNDQAARLAQQAAQAHAALGRTSRFPNSSESPYHSSRGAFSPEQEDSYRQAWPGLLSFLQEEEDDTPPAAPETQARPIAQSKPVPGLQYLSFPRGESFYAPLQSAAATRNANRSLFLAPSPADLSEQSSDNEGAYNNDDDVEMESPGTWQLLSELSQRRRTPGRRTSRVPLPRLYARYGSPTPPTSTLQHQARDVSHEEDEEEDAGLSWLAQELLQARLQSASGQDGTKPISSNVVVLDDGTIGDTTHDVSALPRMAKVAPLLSDPQHGASSAQLSQDNSEKPDETRLARDLANEFGAGLPIETPIAVEEPGPAPSTSASASASAPDNPQSSNMSRDLSRARATTVMDEEEEDELEGRTSGKQARK